MKMMMNGCCALFLLLCSFSADGQPLLTGRVVINEYLPWPSNACGEQSEFIELLNMGPGVADIGCHVITDGDFSITIPAGTLLQPGQFYVITGQDIINAPCANLSRNIMADLNWSTCQCTSAPIPTSGDGLFTDGGFAREQLVLLDPLGQPLDAIVRALPAEPSSLITTAASSSCPSFTFDLDDMNILYETVGESAGRGNTFARRTDGDCGWVKESRQTGGASNTTTGENPTLTFSMYITEDIQCKTGTARFIVDQSPAANWFPIDYILARDVNHDGLFTLADLYTSGSDNTAPDLEISGLLPGYYSINIGSQQGCGYQNFTFLIGPCIILPFQLRQFTITRDEKMQVMATLQDANNLAEMNLQGSHDGRLFEDFMPLTFQKTPGTQQLQWNIIEYAHTYFRIRLTGFNRHTYYSSTRKLAEFAQNFSCTMAGYAQGNQILLHTNAKTAGQIRIQLVRVTGEITMDKSFPVIAGIHPVTIHLPTMPSGLYQLRVIHAGRIAANFRFIRQ